MKKLSPFFFILLISIIPVAYATSANAGIAEIKEDTFSDDDTKLDPGEELDVSEDLETIPTEEKTVGGVEVDVSQQVTLNSADAEPIELTNTALDEVTVEIPNGASVAGPSTWDGTIAPPTQVATSGIVQSGFQTPTTSIEVGDPNVILFFDTPVTLILENTNSTVAYKLSGNNTWNLISNCSGTYSNPNNPSEPNECSITDGADTKILTWHFTQFAGLSATPASIPTTTTPSTSSSGGGGEVGIGSPRIFGPGSSGGSSGGTYYGPSDSTPRVFPAWFDNVKDWYRLGDISATEFLNAYQWIIENVMK